uniref:Putative zinc transporter zip10-like protein n=1 Tax=Ixodes ricinus TaxID=34613 RepID=A0A131XZL8_IXORI
MESSHRTANSSCRWTCIRSGFCKQRRQSHTSTASARKYGLLKALQSKRHRSTHCYRTMCFWCHVFLCVLSTMPCLEAKEAPERYREHEYFLRKIFDKYGHNGVMSFEGFEHLLENLGLAQIVFHDHDLSLHRPEGATGFVNQHPHHDHSEAAFGGRSGDDGKGHDHEDHHEDHHGHSQNKRSGDAPDTTENDVASRVERGVPSQEPPIKASFNATGLADVPNPTHKATSITFEKCLTATEILHTFDISPEKNSINIESFRYLCPAIIYQLDQKHCSAPVSSKHIHHHSDGEGVTVDFKVWMYAFLGVLAISLCGLVSVAIVPVMKKVFYQTLIQFLVGLAIGSLTGDAMLHLLPHAMSGHHDHSEEGEGEEFVWHGLAALGGIYVFLIVERFLSIHSNHKHRKHSPKSSNSIQSTHTPKRLRSAVQEEHSRAMDEKLSHHKRGSYSFMDPSGMEALEHLTAVPAEELELSPLGDNGGGNGYMEIVDLKDHDHHLHAGDGDAPLQPDKSQDLVVIVKNGGSKMAAGRCPPSPPTPEEDSSHRHPLCHGSRDPGTEECHTETLVFRQTGEEHSFTLTVADHHHHHHHHGHSHEVPSTVAAMAWMVIIGDGLHNFSDGLAIGASFASGLSGGLSTTIAVFCHELPHELGDFAVLLKAGMSVKQAMLYNILSSILCLVGMAIGISLGNIHSASSWIFAGVGGMFLYIALVDMLPELSVNPSHSNSRAVHQLGIQLLGISLGISTMFVIALYERDLQGLMSS